MKNLKYTNEFLKKLEPTIVKNELEDLQKIKEKLFLISEEKLENSEIVKLENLKTKTNSEIFMSEIKLKKGLYSVFWTVREKDKIIITLTKDT